MRHNGTGHGRLGLLAMTIAFTPLALANSPDASTPPTPDQALLLLREGNARFIAGAPESPNTTPARLRDTADNGQNPFATILTCSDSRIPVERLFDRGFGDLFVVRVAGNVSDTDEIGTIEYAVAHLHTPLVIVMGHSSCGAVTAVANNAELHGSIAALVDNILPAVEWVRSNRPGLSPKELINAAIEANVWRSIEDLLSHSPEIRLLVHSGAVKVLGAIYDLPTGRARFMGEHPYQQRLLSDSTAQTSADDPDNTDNSLDFTPPSHNPAEPPATHEPAPSHTPEPPHSTGAGAPKPH